MRVNIIENGTVLRDGRVNAFGNMHPRVLELFVDDAIDAIPGVQSTSVGPVEFHKEDGTSHTESVINVDLLQPNFDDGLVREMGYSQRDAIHSVAVALQTLATERATV